MATASQQTEKLYYGRTRKQYARMHVVAWEYLEECARGNCETTYAGLNQRLDSHRLAWFRFKENESEVAAVGRFLAEMSEQSYADHGIMISAIVRKSDDGRRVGKGFWPLAEQLGQVTLPLTPQQKSRELKRLTKAVMAFYRQGR